MRLIPGATMVAALVLAQVAIAADIPTSRDHVARPGGDLPGDPQIALVKVAQGFTDAINLANAGDGSGRIFVVERIGRIKIVNPDGGVQKEPFLDLTAISPFGSVVQTSFVDQGLYAVAFHPNFADNGYFYLHFASLPFNGDSVIVRFQVDPTSPNMMTLERVNQTAKVVMRIEQPWYNNNGGQIAFGPDGYLYIGLGDGGWEGDPYEVSQNLSRPLGKILRIDVDSEDRPYLIPADNPFANAADERLMVLFSVSAEQFPTIKPGALPEIWAYGVRNPYEFAFDRATGDLFITDVGHNHWEEIIYQPADSAGGENYGWPRMEASFCHPMTGGPGMDDDCSMVGVLPAAQYPHRVPWPGAAELEDDWGCSAQGLGVANYAGMEGVYLIGDWCSGRVFGLGWDGSAWQLQELLQTDLQLTAGGYDEEGHVLAVNANNFYLASQGPDTNPPGVQGPDAYPGGALWRVMPADQVPAGAETARTVR